MSDPGKVEVACLDGVKELEMHTDVRLSASLLCYSIHMTTNMLLLELIKIAKKVLKNRIYIYTYVPLTQTELLKRENIHEHLSLRTLAQAEIWYLYPCFLVVISPADVGLQNSSNCDAK